MFDAVSHFDDDPNEMKTDCVFSVENGVVGERVDGNAPVYRRGAMRVVGLRHATPFLGPPRNENKVQIREWNRQGAVRVRTVRKAQPIACLARRAMPLTITTFARRPDLHDYSFRLLLHPE